MVHPHKITDLTLLPKMLNFFTISVTQSITMHATKNIKFATAQQAKQIYQYVNIKRLYKTNAAMWYIKHTIQKLHVPTEV